MKRTLSPRDLAVAIGVSESSLKRWADAGELDVSRTAGGHRRILVTEAVRFIRARALPLMRPDMLGLNEVPIQPDTVSDSAFHHALLEGRGRDARGILLGRYIAGDSVGALADGPVRSAMTRLGLLWRHDPRGVFIEHRATDCCVQAVTALRTLFEPADDDAYAVGGAIGGDPYLLPSLLAATVLEAEGYLVNNLGADTPVSYLRVALTPRLPALAWISCSTPVSPEVAEEVHQLATLLHERGSLLVIGGRHASDLLPAPAACQVATMTELAAVGRRRRLTNK